MISISIAAVPSQEFYVSLAGQRCKIKLYQRRGNVFLDLSVGNNLIAGAVICRDRVRIIRQPYLKFIGDLVFIDNQGYDDPDYSEFGSRYNLMYLEKTDL